MTPSSLFTFSPMVSFLFLKASIFLEMGFSLCLLSEFGFYVEITDQAVNSTFLSLVKTLDSVREVYEGLCKLKQVIIIYKKKLTTFASFTSHQFLKRFLFFNRLS